MAQQTEIDDDTLSIVRLHVSQAGKTGLADNITAYLAGETNQLSRSTLLACRNVVSSTTDKDGLRETLTNAFYEVDAWATWNVFGAGMKRALRMHK